MSVKHARTPRVTRRDALRGLAHFGIVAAASTVALASYEAQASAPARAPMSRSRQPGRTRVAFVKTRDRAEGVARALALLEPDSVKGQRVLLKPNLNSADPAPGSTDPETLRAVASWLVAGDASRITIGDRSGMGDTRRVMEETGVFALGRELGLDVVVFDELAASDWTPARPAGSLWARGFALPRLVTEVDTVVQTCNLKTHRFGGHFTLSLKNSVGLAAKTIPGQPYDYMRELHASPRQRELIAEINAAYRPSLVVLDGVTAFTTGGPDRGTIVPADVVLAGADRVAVDAVGVSLLRLWGTTPEVSRGAVFEQAQIARAVELGIGIASPAEIELITDDESSQAYANQVWSILTGPA